MNLLSESIVRYQQYVHGTACMASGTPCILSLTAFLRAWYEAGCLGRLYAIQKTIQWVLLYIYIPACTNDPPGYN